MGKVLYNISNLLVLLGKVYADNATWILRVVVSYPLR